MAMPAQAACRRGQYAATEYSATAAASPKRPLPSLAISAARRGRDHHGQHPDRAPPPERQRQRLQQGNGDAGRPVRLCLARSGRRQGHGPGRQHQCQRGIARDEQPASPPRARPRIRPGRPAHSRFFYRDRLPRWHRCRARSDGPGPADGIQREADPDPEAAARARPGVTGPAVQRRALADADEPASRGGPGLAGRRYGLAVIGDLQDEPGRAVAEVTSAACARACLSVFVRASCTIR